MKTNIKNSTTVLSRWTRFLGAMLMAALMVPAVAVSQSSPLAANPLPVILGTSGDFVILTKSGISTTGNTAITGDIGVSPIGYAAITGFTLIPTVPNGSNTFATSSLVTGKVYAADYSAPTPAKMTTAVGDMETAYTNAAGRTPPDYTELYSGDVTGQTLTRGLYKWSTGLLISAGGVTISGSATDVWIFQIAQDLTVANGAIVTLSGGAQACNIFWQVTGQTTIGTTAAMKGTILCKTLIAMNTGAKLDGRALAQTAVTLIADTVKLLQCSVPAACSDNVPPVFVSPTPTCGTIFNVVAGTPVSFTVKASDANPGPVQLGVIGLPAGATMTPVLPTNGNPVQSAFSWTPTSGQTGSTVVTFTAQDTCGGLAQCSFTFVVTCADNAPPSCTVTAIIPGPPKQVLVTVRDLQSGLASITVVTAINVTVSIPAFTVGTTNPVVVTATKINQSLSATIALRVTDVCGNSIVCDPVYTTISAEVPQEFALGANYPNPFNPSTKINFNISKPEGSVSLKVFDVLGREVKTLMNEPMQPGQYFVEWDGTNNQGNAVTSGVYIYRMVAGEFIGTRRMTLMK